MTYTAQERANIDFVKRFFESTSDESILTRAGEFFTDSARYIFIRGGQERLGYGDETGPESLISSEETAYSKSLGGLPLTGFNFVTGENYKIKVVPVVGGYPTPKTLAETNAYSEVSFAHERKDLIPFSGNYVGPEGVEEFYTDFLNNYEILSFITTTDQYFDEKGEISPNPYGYIAQGDNVAVFGEFVLKNKYTGNLAVSPFRIDVELKEGKINVYQFWTDTHSLAASARVGGSWRGQYSLTADGEYVNAPLYVQWGTGDDEELSGFSDRTVYYDPEIPNDQLFGYQGNDTLIGLEGDDQLWGGSGNDNLLGGDGNDKLYGNTGLDTINGGSGSDLFVLSDLFNLASEETKFTIEDFSVAEGDKIGLAGTLTLDQLTITRNGSDVEISITDTAQTLASLKDYYTINEDALTSADFQLVRPPYTIGKTTPDDVIGNAEANRSLVLGFFQSFLTGNILNYIGDNFTEDARYIVIQGANNDYTADNTFSHERFLLTPSTKEWTGIEGAKGFIETIFQAVDVLGTTYPDLDNVTNFYIEKIVVDSEEPDNIAVFGRFLYRMRSTGQLTDGPFAYNIQIKNVVNEETGETTPKIDHISFFEDYYAFGYAARQGGSWTRNYNGELTNFFYGTKQGESLVGSDIDDVIYGYQENDTINGGEANDTLYGGEANDKVAGGEGDDHLWGNNGNDTLVSARGDDQLQGGAGNDNLVGGSGNDTLVGNYGNDIPTGGRGNDRFVISASARVDTVTDFRDGQDLIRLWGNLEFGQLSIAQGIDANARDTLIRDTSNDQLLAILSGVSSSSITEADFISV